MTALNSRGLTVENADDQDSSYEIVRLIVGVMGYTTECEPRNIKHRTSEGRAVGKVEE